MQRIVKAAVILLAIGAVFALGFPSKAKAHPPGYRSGYGGSGYSYGYSYRPSYGYGYSYSPPLGTSFRIQRSWHSYPATSYYHRRSYDVYNQFYSGGYDPHCGNRGFQFSIGW
jgi:hypothetical protein